jgi:hypothetical protein
MTSAVELLIRCRDAGILLIQEGDRLTIDAPANTLTDELRASLVQQKPVLWRLTGMQANVGRVPVPCAVLTARGGPGKCFSCGEPLDHPQGYGRCVPCQVAAELFYRETPNTRR